MPKVSRFQLPPIDGGKETIGQRLARIRKERGFTQVEMAEKIGIIQSLVSSYEHDVLKLSAEMAVRFARVLEVTTDELLQPSPKGKARMVRKPSRKFLRRIEQMAGLPPTQQVTLLRTIDTFLKLNAVR